MTTEESVIPKSVFVIGESLVDVVRTGDGEVRRAGGSPMNVAFGLARLGREAWLLTRIAKDSDGALIRQHLEEGGVELLEESVSASRTSSAVAVIESDGSARYTFDVDWTLPSFGGLHRASWLHVGSIATFLNPGADSVERLLREAGGRLTISYDPNIRPALIGDHGQAVGRFERICSLSSVVKFSDEDAEWLYPNTSPESVVDRVLQLGPAVVALTRGASGARVAAGTQSWEVAAPKVEVVDTIGAGDSFMATLISELVGADLERPDPTAVQFAAERATVAAALTCTRSGANPPTGPELDAAFAGRHRS